MNWRDLVLQAFREGIKPPEPVYPRFAPGASEAHLREAERRLGVTIPEDLRNLLAECDGIMEVMDIHGRPIDTHWLIWPTETLVDRNRDPGRATVGLPGSWLIFATADGRDFGYDLHEGEGHIWLWRPIDGESDRVAPSLPDFLRRWINGELKL
jgi:hypothetical protein